MINVKTIVQFIVKKGEKAYIAEGVDLSIVTEADTLDLLVKKIEEAVNLHLENEDLTRLDYSKKPSILINYELSQYA